MMQLRGKMLLFLLVFFSASLFADDLHCATVELLDRTHFILQTMPECSTRVQSAFLTSDPDSEIAINFMGDGLLPYLSSYPPSARQLSLFRAKRAGGISCAALVLPLTIIGIAAGIENIPAGESYGPLGPDPSSGWGYQKVYIQKTNPLFWTMLAISGTSILTSVYCWATARWTLKKSVKRYNMRLSTSR